MSTWGAKEDRGSGVDPEVEALANAVIGAAIEVHCELGPGLSELHYRNSLSIELARRGIDQQCEVPVQIQYKGAAIGELRLDMLVRGKLIVELKAVDSLAPVHRAQALTYLRATHLQLALLVNFNVALLKDGIKRVINTT